ncbi:Na(+)/H(+) antiporter subunit E [compost metagenome]|jgi:multicomponent Na+:H+ antiporter subunit E|uniref:Na+/H+ antiporter subunit E n=2 Tax=Sphingobacterium TaxID=28453 RepID=UPI0004E5F3C2|nr:MULTISPECIES: Na+/H+ antiporter subunit E [Sphingobacterium]CDS91905.1 CPA3 family monovalent cation:proton (H+) antiporter-3 subunit E [Sphingobacterium sp. PM2-P1-29]HCU45927.1 Na+/H+ antiporter subunit E [Sphingobacterium sp.]MQP27440.1 Na+/H+ antiporter subunit E [Sphingobacterium faecium]PTX12913.1 multicomponent Na+:H+ antiporter subunit E [Sphingobacterium faecium]UPZ38307.1 Na+/H+ antiporter subunit E [Sphingobacterium sp. PCS056]
MIKQFLMNLLLSFIWVALTGSMYYTNFLFGFLLGFFILWVMNRNEVDQRYFYRVPKTISFLFFFFYQMIIANLQVAYDVITPKYFFKPGIVKYRMDAKSDFEINLLSTFISLTPGTLILDVSDDKKILYIHVMYLHDKQKFMTELKNNVERKLLEILR